MTPSVFLDWPAMGDVTIGQAMYLAPFIDYDGDGYYDPANGDPCMPPSGPVLHLQRCQGPRADQWSAALGVEVHGMACAFGSDRQRCSRPCSCTTGSSIELDPVFRTCGSALLRPGPGQRHGRLRGHGCGPQPGPCAQRHANDEDGFTPGLWRSPPAFGIVQLSGGLLPATGADEPADNNMPTFNGYGFGDGLVDNERSGLSVTRALGNGFGPTGEPTTAPQYHYQLEGHFSDGTSQLCGGIGTYLQLRCRPEHPSLFIYPDTSDPSVRERTAWHKLPWSEASAVNQPGDRRT